MPRRLLLRVMPGFRGGLTLAVAFAALVCGVRGTQNAVANGDTRTISIRHMHTKEEITVTFRRDGRYVAEALEKLNWALRDWRVDEPIKMDPRLFDVAWEVQRAVGSEQPFHVVSAYRSPGTNSMLRRRSRGVAKHSQHTLGKAMDFYLPDTSTARIREAGMRLQRGGVGFYPGAHTPFVHLDAGSVRSWPRMTRDQLVRLFPDEKTVHLPADGQPLAGYELAKADVLARGGAVAGYAAADLDEGAVISSGRKSLWAALFGGDDEEADARPQRGRAAAPKPQPVVMAYARQNYADSSSEDGGTRFGASLVAAPAPEPAPRMMRPSRQAPVPPEPQPVQVAALAPAPVAEEIRPKLIDAPFPIARPGGLTPPAGQPGAVQVAALPQQGGALAFAPQLAPGGRPGEEQKLILASLPPRRPGEMTTLVETIVAGKPMAAPLPPSRPVAFANLATASLRGSDADPAPAIQQEGKLVTIAHPMPPSRPQLGSTAIARTERNNSSSAPHTPIVAQYDADRSNLDSLFAAVSRPLPEGRKVTVATARAKAASAPPSGWVQGPSPAASLGFSHADPSDAKTGSFSGPAVKPLPTNFVQN